MEGLDVTEEKRDSFNRETPFKEDDGLNNPGRGMGGGVSKRQSKQSTLKQRRNRNVNKKFLKKFTNLQELIVEKKILISGCFDYSTKHTYPPRELER